MPTPKEEAIASAIALSQLTDPDLCGDAAELMLAAAFDYVKRHFPEHVFEKVVETEDDGSKVTEETLNDAGRARQTEHLYLLMALHERATWATLELMHLQDETKAKPTGDDE